MLDEESGIINGFNILIFPIPEDRMKELYEVMAEAANKFLTEQGLTSGQRTDITDPSGMKH